jgi:hypothetical protein
MIRVTSAAVALVATAAMTTGVTTLTETSAEAGAARTQDAGYALGASGFGTRLDGGQLPAGSRVTAFMVLGCSTRTGVHRENHEAEATLPGLGTASGIRTDVWTRRGGGGVHSYSENRIAKVTIGQMGLGSLELTAIDSLSHTWHDAKGFHAQTSTSVGGIAFVGPDGVAHQQKLPTPNQPLEIPGLAKIEVGSSVKRVSSEAAIAVANALKISLVPTGSTLKLAHSSSRVLDGVKHGTFHGSSAATRVSAADGNLTSGPNPLSLMSCRGTDGRLVTKSIADLNLGDQVVVQAAQSQQRGTQRRHKSVAMERGTLAMISLGGGQLVIKGVVGQANVTRTDRGRTTKSATGTTVGSIVVNGQEQSVPTGGQSVEVPGLARVLPGVVEKTRHGISVVALRIQLLDGTLATIDLGVARASIRPR